MVSNIFLFSNGLKPSTSNFPGQRALSTDWFFLGIARILLKTRTVQEDPRGIAGYVAGCLYRILPWSIGFRIPDLGSLFCDPGGRGSQAEKQKQKDIGVKLDLPVWVPNGSYRVSIHHPLGFNWHPLEGAATFFWIKVWELFPCKRNTWGITYARTTKKFRGVLWDTNKNKTAWVFGANKIKLGGKTFFGSLFYFFAGVGEWVGLHKNMIDDDNLTMTIGVMARCSDYSWWWCWWWWWWRRGFLTLLSFSQKDVTDTVWVTPNYPFVRMFSPSLGVRNFFGPTEFQKANPLPDTRKPRHHQDLL